MKLMQVIYGDSSYPIGTETDAVETADAAAVVPWLVQGLAQQRRPGEVQSEADPAGGGLQIRSSQGQRFRNWILRGRYSTSLEGLGEPQDVTHGAIGYDAAGCVVREMAPLYKPPSGSKSKPGFRDIFGAFAARPAFSIPIIPAFRYSGQLPDDEFPTLDKPAPWRDATLGRP